MYSSLSQPRREPDQGVCVQGGLLQVQVATDGRFDLARTGLAALRSFSALSEMQACSARTWRLIWQWARAAVTAVAKRVGAVGEIGRGGRRRGHHGSPISRVDSLYGRWTFRLCARIPRTSAVQTQRVMVEVERAIVAADEEKFWRAILGTMRDFPTDTQKVLRALGGMPRPTLLAWGRSDNVPPVVDAHAMHAALLGSELVVLAGSHNDPWLVPGMREPLRDAFLRFLRAHP